MGNTNLFKILKINRPLSLGLYSKKVGEIKWFSQGKQRTIAFNVMRLHYIKSNFCCNNLHKKLQTKIAVIQKLLLILYTLQENGQFIAQIQKQQPLNNF